jgi:threonyl-tRNA synthetase
MPFMLVVGAREAERGQVAVRERGRGDTGAVSVEDFINRALRLIRSKAIELSKED